MGLFGFGDSKKKNTELKKEIIRELEGINSTSSEMNKKIMSLENMVSEHSIIGTKEETETLQKIISQVAHIKTCINTGKESAARTTIEKTIANISENWALSKYADKYEEDNDALTDLDSYRDSLAQAYKRKEELLGIIQSHPEQKEFYKVEWNDNFKKIQFLQSTIAKLEQEHAIEKSAKDLKELAEQQRKTEERQQENRISEEFLQKQIDSVQEAQKRQDSLYGKVAESDSILYGQGNTGGFMGLDDASSASSSDSGFLGMEDIGGSTAKSSGTKDSITIANAKKKCEENLAKFEAANEDLKEQLAEKDREYNRVVEKAKELLAQRDEMAPAQYNTIDYKIDELKIKLKSLAKEKQSYQNILTQNNLKISMLNQLKTETNLDVLGRYNIDMISTEDLAYYLSSKGDEKNGDLKLLDAITNGLLSDKVSSLTDVADSANTDLTGISGDPNAFDDFKEAVGYKERNH